MIKKQLKEIVKKETLIMLRDKQTNSSSFFHAAGPDFFHDVGV